MNLNTVNMVANSTTDQRGGVALNTDSDHPQNRTTSQHDDTDRKQNNDEVLKPSSHLRMQGGSHTARGI